LTTDRRERLTAALGEDVLAYMRRVREETKPPAAPPGYRRIARHISERTGIPVDFTTLRAWERAQETAA